MFGYRLCICRCSHTLSLTTAEIAARPPQSQKRIGDSNSLCWQVISLAMSFHSRTRNCSVIVWGIVEYVLTTSIGPSIELLQVLIVLSYFYITGIFRIYEVSEQADKVDRTFHLLFSEGNEIFEILCSNREQKCIMSFENNLRFLECALNSNTSRLGIISDGSLGK